jgi:2-haloacid dehalogenase
MNRRQFVEFAAGATVAFSAMPVRAATSRDHIKAIALDPHAVFDTRPVFSQAEQLFPRHGEELSSLWRTRQFEYTWLRTLGHEYADFWQVSEEALLYACKAFQLSVSRADCDRLLQGYLSLHAWPEAVAALKKLSSAGLRVVLLSNFTSHMLDAAVKNSGLVSAFELCLSTDRVKAFKPDPRAYALATDSLRLRKEEILFAPFAGWDVAGAKWFGYPTFWVNRNKTVKEELGVIPDGVGIDLNDLVSFVAEARRDERE